MDNDEPYSPISCGVHDQLLALATLKRECELTVTTDADRPETVRGLIVDVYSSGGAEYLRLADGSTFRLDRIRALDGDPVE